MSGLPAVCNVPCLGGHAESRGGGPARKPRSGEPLVGALSVAGAIFLILELNDPYHGLMRISDEPLRKA